MSASEWRSIWGKRGGARTQPVLPLAPPTQPPRPSRPPRRWWYLAISVVVALLFAAFLVYDIQVRRGVKGCSGVGAAGVR